MNRIELTVFFEDPFWVAVFERRNQNHYEVARHVFGAEPTGPEVYQFVLQSFFKLGFSSPVRLALAPVEPRVNPKRRQREARREMAQQRTCTRAQETLQQQWETHKQIQQGVSRQAHEEEVRRKYALRQLKRKQKHLGH
jgi:hypothetical protein